MSTSMSGSVFELEANLALVGQQTRIIIKSTGGNYTHNKKMACKMGFMKTKEVDYIAELMVKVTHGLV